MPKNAVPPGTTGGNQLVRLLKSSDAGVDSQVASCALAAPGANVVTATNAKAMVASSAVRRQFSHVGEA